MRFPLAAAAAAVLIAAPASAAHNTASGRNSTNTGAPVFVPAVGENQVTGSVTAADGTGAEGGSAHTALTEAGHAAGVHSPAPIPPLPAVNSADFLPSIQAGVDRNGSLRQDYVAAWLSQYSVPSPNGGAPGLNQQGRDLAAAIADALTNQAHGAAGGGAEGTEPATPPGPAGAGGPTTLWTRLAELFPTDPTGNTGLGDENAKAGKDKEAVVDYTKALAQGAKPEVRYKRGLAAEHAGDHELANADAAAVLRFDPDNAAAHSLFMLTRGRLSSAHLIGGEKSSGEGEAAGTRADGGPGQSPEQVAAELNAELAGQTASAAEAALLAKAGGALKVGDTATALRITDELLAKGSQGSLAHYIRANAFLQRGDPAAAAREASAGLQFAPGNAPLLYTQAVAYGRQKLWDAAARAADQAVKSAPRKGFPYEARAGVNWGLGRRAGMLADLRAGAAYDKRLQAALARAEQGPQDVDPTMLFGAAAPAAAPAAPASRAPRYALWAAGAVLAGLGLLPVLFADVRRRVTTVLRRGPSQDEEAPAGEGAEAPVGAFWRRYDVTREIGAGGMGVVYEAWDKNLERRVAVKRMRDEIKNDRRERERFLQEARTVAQLRHPNLVEIYSIEEDPPDAYLVFEFVEGKTLHDTLFEKGALAPAEARDVFRGVCDGLDYAHRRGIVHRDLKPANVIVQPDGVVKVMDFGVARQAADAMMRQSVTNTVIGTPPYMAPEQENGVVCAQGDVYALGICLYEALTGVLPFQGTPGAILMAKLAARFEPLDKRVGGLPPGLERLVERALDPKPETRVQSALEFWRELDAAVTGVGARR